MKKNYFILACAVFIFCACKKFDIQPAAVNADPLILQDQNQSSGIINRSASLTAHPWIYYSYYYHYIDQLNKGDVLFKRGSSNNIVDLGKTVLTYSKDGTMIENIAGVQYNRKWRFSDSTAALLIITGPYGVKYDSIVTLTNKRFSYTTPFSDNNTSYLELIPAP